eukprot:352544-Chlamydomonas_euryale.AAC.4
MAFFEPRTRHVSSRRLFPQTGPEDKAKVRRSEAIVSVSRSPGSEYWSDAGTLNQLSLWDTIITSKAIWGDGTVENRVVSMQIHGEDQSIIMRPSQRQCFKFSTNCQLVYNYA